MTEPLTKSSSTTNFVGKAHNNHPQWYKLPLRLTKEQKKDPLSVLDDFFQSYHLNDVREILWQWLREVLSSQRSIASEPHYHNNHIYFYEMVEGIIEAAYMMRRKIHKHRRKQEKRRLKRKHQSEKDQVIGTTRINANISGNAAESVNVETIFNKPKELIEYVSENPNYVITEVFKSYDLKRHESLAFLRDQLRGWLFVAISADTAIYEEGEQRKQLMVFLEQLLVLIEALFVINIKNTGKDNLEEKDIEANKPRLLNQEQIANPMKVVTTFFEKFPVTYCIRELNDWLEAGIAYSGEYPENMDRFLMLYTYRHVLCLIKSANRLLKQ